MGQREQTYKVKVVVNFDTPFAKTRTFFPTGKDGESATNKVKKFGKVISCVKYVTEGYLHKTEFIDKKKGDIVVDDSFTLKEALDFKNNIVIEDGFTLGKSMRLQRIERNIKEKHKTIDELFDEEDKEE